MPKIEIPQEILDNPQSDPVEIEIPDEVIETVEEVTPIEEPIVTPDEVEAPKAEKSTPEPEVVIPMPRAPQVDPKPDDPAAIAAAAQQQQQAQIPYEDMFAPPEPTPEQVAARQAYLDTIIYYDPNNLLADEKVGELVKNSPQPLIPNNYNEGVDQRRAAVIESDFNADNTIVISNEDKEWLSLVKVGNNGSITFLQGPGPLVQAALLKKIPDVANFFA
jgi:hypothetical protein